METIPRMPIVDTGPLFDFLWLGYCEGRGYKILPEDFRYLTSEFSRAAIRWYFSVAKPLLTCPQVIVEVHGHAQRKRLKDGRLRDFWRAAHQELAGLGLDEDLVKLLHMDREILCSFGPADAALIHMANRRRELNCSIFTGEGKLDGHCRKKEIRVLSVGEVIGLWQRFGSMGAV
ncbi:MAG: hypothetical protein HZA19_01605 [Nitrospirae bacterium]|nr:hypothetical protein [Nitrospirota bacterium]